jgi:hypothetical protein
MDLQYLLDLEEIKQLRYLPLVAKASRVEGGEDLIDSMQFRGRRSLRLVP